MKKTIFLLLSFLLFQQISWAKHIKGGWILYEYQSSDAINHTTTYKITVTVFYTCDATQQMAPKSLKLGIFDAVTYASSGGSYTATFSTYNNADFLQKTTFSPCMSNPPVSSLCYKVATYISTATLPENSNGYIIGVETEGHRVANIINVSNSENAGLTLTAIIPGTINGVDYHINTSPTFLFTDTAIVCYNSKFTYAFAGRDSVDKDSLSYSFGNGLNTNSSINPPYPSLTYNSPYSGAEPLGANVTIDPATGLISGTAPSTTGEYVIAVYVKEWRGGVLIDSIKKELQIYVYNCSLLGASLQKTYVNCDSLKLSFQNENTASNVSTYLWNFGDPTSATNTSTSPIGTHTFSKVGDYVISLTVSNSSTCTDKATAIVRVYPGFTPNFKVVGSCYQSDFVFTDATIASYGVVDSWKWNFGDPTLQNNTATTPIATHRYSKGGDTLLATLAVTSSVGCSGSFQKKVIVNDKPYIYFPFTDTLICAGDTLPLIAITTGTSYTWSNTHPNQHSMIDSLTLNPKVFPNDTTIYTLTAHENGCVGSANDTVFVLPFITVRFSPDTMHLCKTDSITLKPISHALSYHWSEAAGNHTLSSYTVKNPKASPSANTTVYHLDANLGHCPDSRNVTVFASPYPKVKIAPKPDTTICYGGEAFLRATITAAYSTWSPTNTLTNATTLSPTAHPLSSTVYKLTVTDTFYCPKPVTDSVLVVVTPPVRINAGSDTNTVVKEPLQMTATLIDTSFHFPLTYSWSPSTFLNNHLLQNPLLTATSSSPATITYAVTATTTQGCTGTDSVKVRIFNTLPDIFIPTAFSPNGDRLNDKLTPILVGIAQFDYFKVYNRFGQLVFSTSKANDGWTGIFNGTNQNAGTYVYMAQGVDYLGNTISKKGTVVMIK